MVNVSETTWPRTCSSSDRPPRRRRSTSTSARTSPSLASYGHVRDLVPQGRRGRSRRTTSPCSYELIEKNEKHVDAIAKAAQGAPLRSISRPTRIARARRSPGTSPRSCSERGLLEGKALHRVVFTEITPHAIRRRSANPRTHRRATWSNAQQARARARLPGRLQPVAGAVAQGAARPVRRPRAVAGAAHDRRARGRDRSVQGAASTGRIEAELRASASRRFTARLAKLRRPEVRAVHRSPTSDDAHAARDAC